MTTAAERWTLALATWAIPQHILDAAPESPWVFPVELFASRADVAVTRLTPSNERALEALPDRGTVLDVGCGGGAASLPLASKASAIVGVDSSHGMLEALLERTKAAGVQAQTIEGAWPDVADATPMADVVVCNHVAYNAADLAGFTSRLTDHARHGVVMELTAAHPLSTMNELWLQFHGVQRPVQPTADLAVEVLEEMEVHPGREDWTSPGGGGFARRQDLVAFVRRRLCLTADRDPEIDAALGDRVVQRDGTFGFPPRPVVTLWWDGSAQEARRVT